MHVTSSPVDWYAARAAGIAAYLVLTFVVTFGLAMSGKAQSKTWPKFAIEDVHRFGGLLVGFFVSIHVLTIAMDSYLPFSLTQLIVPFTARYRPLWTGLGIAAAELLVALALTNHYRRRISFRFWRRAHYLNFAVWTGATLHGLGSGTDRNAPWLLLLYAASAAAIVTLILWRALRPQGRVLVGGAVAAQLLHVRKELRSRLPAVEERRLVPLLERRVHERSSEKPRTAEDEDSHPG